ncbi:M15 family metallopeptidase [Snuella sedimenti]|uniref:D-alanyl-D-alanine dipeptidase n=1 Tax=Snuella sedimenti TaxID=2798802 RepID=A0A8J7IRC4_9FLAO|nr:M15 family metallopeptidase [Snuella sedimenti]MBJ6369717.1 M15 family metallopeptidase [Snuella sedimenti]
MKVFFKYIILLYTVIAFGQLPEGFVYVQDVIPNIKVELRYHTSDNFVGSPIDGYQSNRLILTEVAALALKRVQNELEKQNLCLYVFDGYRPQQAVNHFINWARELNDTINKQRFYPNVEKKCLFKEEYIATRSGHSKGSTVDLTILDGTTNKLLDMGSPYDFFGKESWVDYQGLTDVQKSNRQLLQTIMLKYGFKNYHKEWWHFTLREEPYPKTYFDFPVE